MPRQNYKIDQLLTQLIKQNHTIICQVCKVYYPCDRYRQMDLYNDVIYRIWKGIDHFKGKSTERTWIYRIAINTAINHYTTDIRIRKNISITLAMEESLPNEEDNQLITELYELIEHLNPLEKAVIYLYLDRKKQVEIGQILGLSETNVSTIIGRIKSKLRKIKNNEKPNK